MSSGAVSAVVVALKVYPGVAAVVEQGCAALAHFSCSDAGQEACVASGAVPEIVAALKAHAAVAAVAEQGCLALRHIACCESGLEACVSSGAVPAVVASLTAHLGAANVAAHGCGALENLAASESVAYLFVQCQQCLQRSLLTLARKKLQCEPAQRSPGLLPEILGRRRVCPVAQCLRLWRRSRRTRALLLWQSTAAMHSPTLPSLSLGGNSACP